MERYGVDLEHLACGCDVLLLTCTTKIQGKKKLSEMKEMRGEDDFRDARRQKRSMK